MIPEGVAATSVGWPCRQEAGVRGMEAVHVLHRGDRVDHAALVDVVGQRQLDEDPGHPLVGVQLGDEREQLVLRRVAASSWWMGSIPTSSQASCFLRT